MSINYHTLSEFDLIADYTKRSGFGSEIILGLQSIADNWDHFQEIDEDLCDAYEEVILQLSEFMKLPKASS
jgi:hypothetical protein